MAVTSLRAGPSDGLPGQAPEQRDWVKFQSAKSGKVGQDSTGVDKILLSQLVNVALKASIATEQLGPLALKGLTQPVVAYNVPLAATQPALRVIEGGPPSG